MGVSCYRRSTLLSRKNKESLKAHSDCSDRSGKWPTASNLKHVDRQRHSDCLKLRYCRWSRLSHPYSIRTAVVGNAKTGTYRGTLMIGRSLPLQDEAPLNVQAAQSIPNTRNFYSNHARNDERSRHHLQQSQRRSRQKPAPNRIMAPAPNRGGVSQRQVRRRNRKGGARDVRPDARIVGRNTRILLRRRGG